MATTKSELGTSKIEILKKAEPVPQSLLKTEPEPKEPEEQNSCCFLETKT